jgi:hypothetical protein
MEAGFCWFPSIPPGELLPPASLLERSADWCFVPIGGSSQKPYFFWGGGGIGFISRIAGKQPCSFLYLSFYPSLSTSLNLSLYPSLHPPCVTQSCCYQQSLGYSMLLRILGKTVTLWDVELGRLQAAPYPELTSPAVSSRAYCSMPLSTLVWPVLLWAMEPGLLQAAPYTGLTSPAVSSGA